MSYLWEDMNVGAFFKYFVGVGSSLRWGCKISNLGVGNDRKIFEEMKGILVLINAENFNNY